MVMLRGGICLVLFTAGAALAQDPPPDAVVKRAALAGVIRDTIGRPIPLATVHVEGKDLSAVSDDSGRFHLAGIPAGLTDFAVMRIGYKSVSFTTTLAPDTTLVIAIQLRRIQTLEQVEVRAASVSARLERQGFYDRRRRGIGSFLTPERIDSLSYVSTPAQLLRDVRGLEVQCGGGRCSVSPRRAHKCLNLFVDGVFSRDSIDDRLTTNMVSAIEVYENPNMVPTEFQAPLPAKRNLLTAKAGCGALVVWTKSRAP